MKEVLLNEKRCFFWEPHETVQRKCFEEAFVGQESVDAMMQAFLKAMQEAAKEKRRAWEQLLNLLPEDARGNRLSYRFIEGCVAVDKDKPKDVKNINV